MRSTFINLLCIGALLSAPISLGGIGWGLYLVSEAAPLWVFMGICFSVGVTGLGIALLIDELKSQ